MENIISYKIKCQWLQKNLDSKYNLFFLVIISLFLLVFIKLKTSWNIIFTLTLSESKMKLKWYAFKLWISRPHWPFRPTSALKVSRNENNGGLCVCAVPSWVGSMHCTRIWGGTMSGCTRRGETCRCVRQRQGQTAPSRCYWPSHFATTCATTQTETLRHHFQCNIPEVSNNQPNSQFSNALITETINPVVIVTYSIMYSC